jgi:hypothetical protein
VQLWHRSYHKQLLKPSYLNEAIAKQLFQQGYYNAAIGTQKSQHSYCTQLLKYSD